MTVSQQNVVHVIRSPHKKNGASIYEVLRNGRLVGTLLKESSKGKLQWTVSDDIPVMMQLEESRWDTLAEARRDLVVRGAIWE